MCILWHVVFDLAFLYASLVVLAKIQPQHFCLNQTMAWKRKRTAENPFHDLHSKVKLGASSAYTELAETTLSAAAEFRKLLVGKYVSGKMTGEDLSILAWWATKAGATGVEDLGCNPNSNNRGRNAHVEKILGREFEEPRLYKIKCPMHEKIASTRVGIDVPVQLAHEAISEDYENSWESLVKQDEEREWYDVYKEHPTVVRALENKIPLSRIIPIALYWDGVKYSKNDNFIALYIHNLRTGKKYLYFVIRGVLIFSKTLCDLKTRSHTRTWNADTDRQTT